MSDQTARNNTDWINTYTGRQFWPLAPSVEDVDIQDIAHALSLQCRFTGHVREFYSVAQHCCLVAERVPLGDRLWALLHDAPEAYLIDLARPVKRAPAMKGYRDAETRLMDVIARRFGLTGACPESVHEADNRMLMTEAHALMTMHPQWLHEAPWQPYTGGIDPWAPEIARGRFLHRFNEWAADLLVKS